MYIGFGTIVFIVIAVGLTNYQRDKEIRELQEKAGLVEKRDTSHDISPLWAFLAAILIFCISGIYLYILL